MDFSKVILMTDLDGTLLTDDKRILPQDLEAIERFRAGGGLFTMATGRGYSMAKHIADKLRLDCPAVVYNGAAVYDFRQEKFLWQCEIGSRAADIIKRVAERYPDIGVEVLRGNVVHVPFLNDTEQWHLNLENVQADWSKLENIPQDCSPTRRRKWTSFSITSRVRRSSAEFTGCGLRRCSSSVSRRVSTRRRATSSLLRR